MRTLLALLACSMLAMPATADKNVTALIYQHIQAQHPELGPLFRGQYPDVDVESARDAILDGLPGNAVVCVATKTRHGLNFLIGGNKANVLTYYVHVGNDGATKVIQLNEDADTSAATDITIFGSTHIMWVVVPDVLGTRGLSDKKVLALLKETRALLEQLAKTTLGMPL